MRGTGDSDSGKSIAFYADAARLASAATGEIRHVETRVDVPRSRFLRLRYNINI